MFIGPLLSACGRRIAQALTLALGLGGVTAACNATSIYVSAEFAPSATDPGRNTFVNTTPWSGVCNSVHLATCKANNWWSIDTGIRGTKIGTRTSSYGPGSLYVEMPAMRTVTVTSETGRSYTLELHIIGTALRVTDYERDGSRNPASLGGPNAGCRIGLTNGSANNYSAMRMFLRTGGAESRQVCAAPWLESNNFALEEFDLTYKLVTPNPLSMLAGTYTGSTIYTTGGTGSGADFDLGDGVTLTDNQVEVNFTLTVDHDFQVYFPEAAPKVSLAPVGGWTQWTERGVRPTRLQQEFPFLLTSSGEFSVKMRCGQEVEGRCGIEDQSAGTVVPIDVDVTLPGMSELRSGASARNSPLVSEQSGVEAPRFAPETYIINRGARLRFSANGTSVSQMLDAPGSYWQGDVTVIFDSNP
ncbi:hypothetical protein [Xanthomonas sp. 60]